MHRWKSLGDVAGCNTMFKQPKQQGPWREMQSSHRAQSWLSHETNQRTFSATFGDAFLSGSVRPDVVADSARKGSHKVRKRRILTLTLASQTLRFSLQWHESTPIWHKHWKPKRQKSNTDTFFVTSLLWWAFDSLQKLYLSATAGHDSLKKKKKKSSLEPLKSHVFMFVSSSKPSTKSIRRSAALQRATARL